MRVLHAENSSGQGGSLRSLRQLEPPPRGMTSRVCGLIRPWTGGILPDSFLPSHNPFRAWRRLQEERPDVLHLNNAPIEAWGLLLAAAWEGIPIVSQMRSVRLLRRCEQWMSLFLEALVVLSQVHKDRLCTRVRVEVIRHAMEDPGQAPLPTEPVVGLFSILKPGKGHEMALRALSGIDAPWRLRIVGGSLPDQPSTQENLRALALDLGIADRVEFLGQVEDPQPLMRGCLLVIDPSSKAEGFRRTVSEACLLGRVVLASDTGGEGDLLPADQILPASDVAAWTRALQRFLCDRPAAERRGAESRLRALELLAPANKKRFWDLVRHVGGRG